MLFLPISSLYWQHTKVPAFSHVILMLPQPLFEANPNLSRLKLSQFCAWMPDQQDQVYFSHRKPCFRSSKESDLCSTISPKKGMYLYLVLISPPSLQFRHFGPKKTAQEHWHRKFRKGETQRIEHYHPSNDNQNVRPMLTKNITNKKFATTKRATQCNGKDGYIQPSDTNRLNVWTRLIQKGSFG